MNADSVFIPAKERRHHKRKRVESTTPAAALVLTAATYDPGTSVTLTFDRAIDISALVGSQIVVEDGIIFGSRYEATGSAVLIEPDSVEIALTDVGPTPAVVIEMTASAASGIVAVDDGGEWAGVTNLHLPFP